MFSMFSDVVLHVAIGLVWSSHGYQQVSRADVHMRKCHVDSRCLDPYSSDLRTDYTLAIKEGLSTVLSTCIHGG